MKYPIRVSETVIRNRQELALPPIIDEFTRKPNGLVLITGPTGTGKTTTMNYMLDMIIRDTVRPKEPPVVYPDYDEAYLGFAIQAALREFHGRWLARLGFSTHDGYSREAWQTIKALTRRLGDGWSDQFRDLMPVAELVQCLQERLRVFLGHPANWRVSNGHVIEDITPEMMEAAVNVILNDVHRRLQEMARQRIFISRIPQWSRAYNFYRGPGSTSGRVTEIRNLYESAAPIPIEAFTAESRSFIGGVRTAVREAVETSGGSIGSGREARDS